MTRPYTTVLTQSDVARPYTAVLTQSDMTCSNLSMSDWIELLLILFLIVTFLTMRIRREFYKKKTMVEIVKCKSDFKPLKSKLKVVMPSQ